VVRIFVLAVITTLTLAGCCARPDRLATAATPPGEGSTVSPPPSDSTDGLRSGALFDALAEMDRILFDASFVSCDAAKANAIFTDDVEFYHDQTGFAAGEQVRENTRRLTASCPRDRGVERTIVPGSLRVYPIEGYGAVQMGVHRFDERGAATSTLARFVSLWRWQDGRWRLAIRPNASFRPASKPSRRSSCAAAEFDRQGRRGNRDREVFRWPRPRRSQPAQASRTISPHEEASSSARTVAS
jgi:hypothetical protein